MYIEIQKDKPWWIYLIIVPLCFFSFWSFIQQIFFEKPFGQNPAPDWGVWLILVFCGIFLPWLLIQSKQTITFDGVTVVASYFPFWKTKFRMDEIDKYYRRDFNPMRDFWGWGIRYGLSGKNKWIMAYVYFNENSGVQFEFKSGRRILLGSRQVDTFLSVLQKSNK
jgi:hypothetical protein